LKEDVGELIVVPVGIGYVTPLPLLKITFLCFVRILAITTIPTYLTILAISWIMSVMWR
jgi:hypothetical protein